VIRTTERDEALARVAALEEAGDWRDIFVRYVAVVARAEGVDFLHADDWTSAEWAVIEAANADVNVACDRLHARSVADAARLYGGDK